MLDFSINVTNTGYTFYTDSSRNMDGFDHSDILFANGKATIGVEDLYGGGDRDFNDVVFSVSNVSSTRPIAAVPEPATWAMMISGFGAVGAGLRRNRRRGQASAAA